mgnify:CR=1 FL=1
MEVYTHNLKIILVDESGKIILEDGFLEEIKDKLCKINKESEVWDGKEIDIAELYTLPPMDVKSVDILKGGSAAIYGSRGANGVIIINTKRGAD